MSELSPCIQCGACCAAYRVSFHWAELQSEGGLVPNELTHAINPHRNCMEGTSSRSPRCIALAGVIGEQVSCTIYANRPSPCREFSHNLSAEPYNEFCDKARIKYGLPPLMIVQQAS